MDEVDRRQRGAHNDQIRRYRQEGSGGSYVAKEGQDLPICNKEYAVTRCVIVKLMHEAFALIVSPNFGKE